MRRALGAQLRHQGHLLQQFVEFAICEGAQFITTELALRWGAEVFHTLKGVLLEKHCMLE